MNTVTSRRLAVSLVLVGALTACTGSKAPDADNKPALLAGQPVASQASASAASGSAEPAENDAPPTQIPATAEAIWTAIDHKTADLHTTIQSGALGNVHHIAYAIRDLVAALPGKSTALSPDQQGKVQGGVKFVATLAERLDASGDAKDTAGTQANEQKLLSVLSDLRANYPSAK